MQARKAFFSEEKKQKIFMSSLLRHARPAQEAKVFWFFLSKKNILSSVHPCA
jgi:hypothetical protein